MYGVKLSYKQTLDYLKELKGSGLVEERIEDGAPAYRMTEKGRAFLVVFADISSLMDGQSAEVYERYRREAI